MIPTFIALAFGLIATFAGVGCVLAGVTRKKRNYVWWGIALPVGAWLVILVLKICGAFSGEWP